MNCPDCGGPMWDNRETKRSAKQPDYKCKDKDGCGKAVWEKPKGDRGGSTPASTPAPRSTAPLAVVYGEALEIAARAVKHYVPNATPSDIIAAAATIFIGANQSGRPIKQPKAEPVKPKPAPPPPMPEPDDEPYQDSDFSEDLPFS